MARVLLAWELGGDYGHLMRLLALARELAHRGHEPVFALRELTHVEAMLRDEPYAVFQAPVWLATVTGLPPPISLAETLMRLGFLHLDALLGLCRAWRALIRAIDPQLVVFDYAPTALLATRGLGLRRMLFGNSLSVPPASEPIPAYRWWRPEHPGRVIGSERIVVANANAALARLGEAPMRRLADLFACEATVLAAPEDLDVYPGRNGAEYWGSLTITDKGVSPPWPQVGSKRIFAYLKAHFRDLDKLLAALRSVDAAVVVHAPGVSERLLRTHTAANVAFSTVPVRIDDARRDCDLAVCHAGVGTVDSMLAAGKPLLLLPQHLEQMLTAKRVQQLGAALVVDYEKPAPDYARLLRRLLDDPAFTGAARAVALKRGAYDGAASVARLGDRCEQLIGSGSPA